MYIAIKKCTINGIEKTFKLAKHEEVDLINGFLCKNGKICHENSQTAKDFFSYNGDGKGIERREKIEEIRDLIKSKVEARQAQLAELCEGKTEEEISQILAENPDPNAEFFESIKINLYKASIEELDEIISKA